VDSASEQVSKERTGAHHTLTHVDSVQFERDLDTLREFGKDGVPILTPPDFAPSTPKHNTPVRWAKNYTLAPEAVEALVYKAWTAGCGILLTPTAASTIEGRHEMRSSWAAKKGKPNGRLTLDASTNSALVPPYLNSREAKELCRQTFGDIVEQPNIEAICHMLLVIADQHGKDTTVIWKTDLKAAFTLLKLRAAAVHLMSTRLMNGFIFIYTQGNFGWTGMPFAFQVVVRVLIVLAMAVIKGSVDMFVDDMIGVSYRDAWLHDRDAAIRVMRNLLGDDAEEPDKRESSEEGGNAQRMITALGWDF
jgi:hypothetical protein